MCANVFHEEQSEAGEQRRRDGKGQRYHKVVKSFMRVESWRAWTEAEAMGEYKGTWDPGVIATGQSALAGNPLRLHLT